MKIIINGDETKAKRIKRFQCRCCGCLFEAEQDDYLTTHEVAYTTTKSETKYRCRCPVCKTEAELIFEY